MKDKNAIIQGPENGLFTRVFDFLLRAGVARRHLQEFEQYKFKPFDELLEASENYLMAVGCY